MRKLALFGELENHLTESDWGTDAFFTYNDKYENLINNADLLRVLLKDGRSYFSAKTNFSGGTCNCCETWSHSDVLKYEFYKII